MQHPQGKYVVRRIVGDSNLSTPEKPPLPTVLMRSPNDIDKQLGENLLKLRLFRGLSQDSLAQAAGISFQQVQKY